MLKIFFILKGTAITPHICILMCFALPLQNKSLKLQALAEIQKRQSDSLSPLPQGKGGKSGQRRALHFLTESCL